MAHPGVVRRLRYPVEMNGARGVGELVGDVDFVGALRDLERERHVHGARGAGQIAFQLRIAVDPMLGIHLLLRQRFGFVGNLSIALNDAK